MKTFEIQVKNMVCNRCIMFVKQTLLELNLKPISVILGHATFSASNESVLPALTQKLNDAGLQVVTDKTEFTIEQIKIAITKYLNETVLGKHMGNLSEYVSGELAKNYCGLSKLFSKNENVTIEAYAIRRKIEIVKQMLREGELTLSEIAYKLRYTNVQHLSSQFRAVTGQSVAEFRNQFHLLSGSNTTSKQLQAIN